MTSTQSSSSEIPSRSNSNKSLQTLSSLPSVSSSSLLLSSSSPQRTEKKMTISYETFAPRGVSQRSRLALIESMFADPHGCKNNNTNNNNSIAITSTIDQQQQKKRQQQRETSNGSKNDSNGESKNDDNSNDINLAVIPPEKKITLMWAEALQPPLQSPNRHTNDPTTISTTNTTTTDNPIVPLLPIQAIQIAHKTSIHLQTSLHHASLLRSSVSRAYTLTSDITHRHSSLLRESAELGRSAERLKNESVILKKHAGEIGLPLRHYDSVDSLSYRLGVKFDNNSQNDDTDTTNNNNNNNNDGSSNNNKYTPLRAERITEFRTALTKLDDAVTFFAGRVRFAEEAETAALNAANVDIHGNPLPPIINDTMTEREKRRAIRRAARSQDNNGGGSSSNNDTVQSGAREYLRRSYLLRETALDLARTAVADRISNTTKDVYDSLGLRRKPIPGDKLESGAVYTRFHGISGGCWRVLRVLRDRSWEMKNGNNGDNDDGGGDYDNDGQKDGGSSTNKSGGGGNAAGVADREMKHSNDNNGNNKNNTASINDDDDDAYHAMITLCKNAYAKSREDLLRSSVRGHLDSLKERHGLVGMARLASVFLMRLCTVETALYLDFFGKRGIGSSDSSSIDTNIDATHLAENKMDDDSNNNNIDDDFTNHHTTDKVISKKKDSEEDGDIPQPNKADAILLAPHVMHLHSRSYADPDLQALLDSICSNLHRTIRRGLIHIPDLDTLCRIVSVLREERGIAGTSHTTMAAARACSVVVVDAQERLIYRANAELNTEVICFRPKATDLDYPDRLRRVIEMKEKVDVVGQGGGDGDVNNGSIIAGSDAGAPTVDATSVTTPGGDSTTTTNPTTTGEDPALQSRLSAYDSWFPPMRAVLRVLSKIFRVVDPNVFEDIALNSVRACTASLKTGSIRIGRKSGVVHADLFLVKNLLIMREQLSPFDIQLRSVERQLDFSDAGGAVSRFLASTNRRLLSMSPENALLSLLREGVSVRDSPVDSKRDLEDALRSACNDFIGHAATSLAGPVVAFAEQCRAAGIGGGDTGKGGGGGIEGNANGGGSGVVGSSGGSKRTEISNLAEHTFLESPYVLAVFTRARDRLEPGIGEVMDNMALYMENSATRGILLRPVARKVLRALEDSSRVVTEAVLGGVAGWDDNNNNESDIENCENSNNGDEKKRGGAAADKFAKLVGEIEGLVRSTMTITGTTSIMSRVTNT